MFIYSGNVRQGDCGMPTGKKDINCKPLFVGDIVVTWSVVKDEKYGEMLSMFGSLSVVVCDKYTSFSNGEHRITSKEPEPFVMGIKTVDFEEEENMWRVFKVKDHSQVIEGEHWTPFGFRFSET